jgi:hypothetical protein
VIRLVHGELVKLRTTWAWKLLLGLAVVVTAGIVVSTIYFGSRPNLPAAFHPDTVAGLSNVYGEIGNAYPFAVLLGVLGMTTEYRYQLVTTTFLAVPRRGRAIIAKMLAYLVAGAGFAAATVAATALTAAITLPALGYRITVPGVPLPLILGGEAVVIALAAVLGVVRNQVGALVGAMAWLYLVEGLVLPNAPSIGRWLPGGAARAVLGLSTPGSAGLLAPWAGVVLFLGYAVVLGTVGWWFAVRRDIS